MNNPNQNRPSLKDKLLKANKPTVLESPVVQPCPVIRPPTPILPATPSLQDKPKASLRDKLLGKKNNTPIMGAAARLERPSLLSVPNIELDAKKAKLAPGQDRPLDSVVSVRLRPKDKSDTVSSGPVPAVVVVAPSPISLADKLRKKIKDKTDSAADRASIVSNPTSVSVQSSQLDTEVSSSITPQVSYADDRLSLKDKIALAKRADIAIESSFEPTILSPESDTLNILDRYGRPITLNKKQAAAVQMAIDGKSFVLTGEAGTGKSTTIEAVLASLLHFHKEKIRDNDYRATDGSGLRIRGPSCAVCAYTRKAIGNVARILSHNFELYAEVEGALHTIHNLLEYAPVIEWSNKQEREVMLFKPQRGSWNKLGITHLVIEEASMVGLDLFAELREALNSGVQIIYVGDINQLPPVFGKSIMSYALTKLPIVHLDIVYRQALDNPIIAGAHAVLHGTEIKAVAPAIKWIKGKGNTIKPQETMSRAMGEFFKLGLANKDLIDKWQRELVEWERLTLDERKGREAPKTEKEITAAIKDKIIYNPDEDIVLIPFNKNAMGTKMINYRIAQHLGEQRNAEVFEIIAGFEKHYLAVGDSVLCNKMEGKIIKISSNMQYMGKTPMKPSPNLSRFGFYIGEKADAATAIMNGGIEEDFGLTEVEIDNLATIDDEIERRQQSSHIVTCELETGQTISLSSAGDFNSQIFQLGYALSVHKAQGSEWKRVFVLFHKAHSTMLSRELLYTAMTRAREELVIVARPELIKKAIGSPRIKGNSLAEKIEYFNSGYLDEDVEVTV